MARPDPALLDPDRYPWQVTITTRFQDIDPNNHINNVAAGGMLEDARTRFSHGLGLREAMSKRGGRAVIASVATEYIDEMFYPDPVLALTGVLAIGRTSWTTGGLLMQGERVAAFARTTSVYLEAGRPAALPDLFRAALDRNLIDLPSPLAV